jgi:hypothetical protein
VRGRSSQLHCRLLSLANSLVSKLYSPDVEEKLLRGSHTSQRRPIDSRVGQLGVAVAVTPVLDSRRVAAEDAGVRHAVCRSSPSARWAAAIVTRRKRRWPGIINIGCKKLLINCTRFPRFPAPIYAGYVPWVNASCPCILIQRLQLVNLGQRRDAPLSPRDVPSSSPHPAIVPRVPRSPCQMSSACCDLMHQRISLLCIQGADSLFFGPDRAQIPLAVFARQPYCRAKNLLSATPRYHKHP